MDANLRSPALGPVLETYGPNIRVVAIVLFLALFFCTVALLFALDLRDRTAWIIFYLLTAAFLLLLLRYLLSKAWLHELGISYRGMLGYGEMRWLDIARLYFGSYELHAHHIPLGTYYRLKLVSIHGKRVSLGERLRRSDDLADRITRFTFEPLLQKAMQDFSADGEVDFVRGRSQRLRSEGSPGQRHAKSLAALNSSTVLFLPLIRFSGSSAVTFLLLLVLFWRHNQSAYKRRYSEWESSFLCQRCGTVTEQE